MAVRPAAASDAAFRDEVRAFFARALPQAVRDKVRDGRPVRKQELAEWQRALAAQGWLVPHWPRDHGGPSWSLTQRWIFDEEYHAAFCPPVHIFNFKMIGPILIRFGTEEQKQRYLPPILGSEDWWCQGYSEPESGSDLASLRTRAERLNDHYVVNGTKIWTSFAHWANRIFCLVRTRSGGKPQEGISFLLIDMASPGITVRPIVSIDGRHHFNQVFFDNVVVPARDLVGAENEGWTIAKSLLEFERLNAARYGESLGRLRRLKQIAAEQRCDGTRLIDQDWFRRKVAEAEVRLLAVQMTALRFLAKAEAGERLGPETSMLKLRGSQVLQHMQDLMLQAVGPEGLRAEPGEEEPADEAVEQLYASAMAPQRLFGRGYTIAAGSSEVQRGILAKHVLGL
jgi:acyl-CoA dehydrogenase